MTDKQKSGLTIFGLSVLGGFLFRVVVDLIRTLT